MIIKIIIIINIFRKTSNLDVYISWDLTMYLNKDDKHIYNNVSFEKNKSLDIGPWCILYLEYLS